MASKLRTKYLKCSVQEQKLLGSLQELCRDMIKHFDFSDYDEGMKKVPLDEYLDKLSIVQQTDGFCFADMYCNNIPVSWVMDVIEDEGSITFYQFMSRSI